jgi:dipeptidyl aminopeptidase/acylaminoacyl peptidase
MNTHPWRLVRRLAAPLIGLLSALCLVPTAMAQPRYLTLTWVDRTGKVVGEIGEAAEYRGLDVSRDGRRVAVHAHSGAGGDIWMFEPNGEGRRLVAEATGVQDNAHPIFSPDGTKIVYVSQRDGAFGLYVKAVDGSGSEELVHSEPRTIVPMSWSPDGRSIVYWDQTGFEWVLPLAGDRKPVRLITDPRGDAEAQSSHSQISPDGNWVAYNAGGGVRVRRFPGGGEAVQVSKDGAFPRWRGDGREIYYTSAVSFGMVMAAAVTATPDKIEVAEPRALFASDYINMGHPSNYHTYAVSPDGQRFLIPRPEPDTLVVLDREGVSRDIDTDLWGRRGFRPTARALPRSGATAASGSSTWQAAIASSSQRSTAPSLSRCRSPGLPMPSGLPMSCSISKAATTWSISRMRTARPIPRS